MRQQGLQPGGQVGVGQASLVQQLLQIQLVLLAVDRHQGAGVVGESPVKAPGDELSTCRHLVAPAKAREDGCGVEPALAQAVDPPVVLVGLFEPLDLCDGHRVQVWVVQVGALVEFGVVPGDHLVVDPAEQVAGVVVQNHQVRGAKDQLGVGLVCQLVGLIDEAHISFTASDLHGGVERNEFHQVACQVVLRAALVVVGLAVQVVGLQDGKKVAHGCRSKGWHGLPHDGDGPTCVPVSQAPGDQHLEDGERLAAPSPSLVHLDPGT